MSQQQIRFITVFLIAEFALAGALTLTASAAPSTTNKTAVAATSASKQDDDWLAKRYRWDVQQTEKHNILYFDIAHNMDPESTKEPDFLTISVLVSRRNKNVPLMLFQVPNTADLAKGLAIAFANQSKDEHGKWTMKIDDASFRILPLGGATPDYDTFLAEVPNAVVAKNGKTPLNLIDHFLRDEMILFWYFADDKPVTASALLKGFQRQYPAVLKMK